nr:hypothetical protein [Morchella crassipes]
MEKTKFAQPNFPMRENNSRPGVLLLHGALPSSHPFSTKMDERRVCMMLFLMLSDKGQCVILPPHRGYAYLPSGGLWCGISQILGKDWRFWFFFYTFWCLWYFDVCVRNGIGILSFVCLPVRTCLVWWNLSLCSIINYLLYSIEG